MIPGSRRLPTHHVTIRVPWHDSGWDGTVCRRPAENTSCMILPRVADDKDDAAEAACSGARMSELGSNHPPCVEERATFLSPDSLIRKKRHPYSDFSEDTHGHVLETPLEFPAFAASCIPFNWMLVDNAEERAELLRLGYDPEIEPDLPFLKGKRSTWIQEHDNQRVMLDTFFGALEPEESLCFFYAKRTPLSEASRRVLIGVGRVKNVGSPVEYDYSTSAPSLRSSLWERNVYHSIRGDGGDGFVLPYQKIVELAEADGSIRAEDYVAFAPDEFFSAYSFGCELLDHDGAIASLLALHASLSRIGELVDGPWDSHKEWIDRELNRLWRARGPFPGLGSALTAFGFERGTLIAYEVAKAQADSKQEHTEDPWQLVDAIVEDPSLLSADVAEEIGGTWRKTWRALPRPRRELLELLSRFSLTAEQAEYLYVSALREESGVDVTDNELLQNPFLMFELTRHWPDAVPFPIIDRGMFPDPVVRERFPIPEVSRVEDAIDPRRVRAAIVHMLQLAADEGHTLLPGKWLTRRIRDADWQPALPITEDVLPVVEPFLADVVGVIDLPDRDRAYQLAEYAETSEIIARQVRRRTGSKAKPIAAKHDWADLVAEGIGEPLPDEGAERETEERARAEKAEALRTIVQSRFSVLVGPAGTGKTTLLKIVYGLESVQRDGVLLLAPTGKARVRLEQATNQLGRGKTIAQFLNALDRYDKETGAYLVNPDKPVGEYGTVIIDESSMLTEQQLAAVFAALTNVKRYILVGDPRQLPPIGAGRPFVDIVRELAPDDVETRFPRVATGYAELTIHRRQKGELRDDLMLAGWFAGGTGGPAADEVWSRLALGTGRSVDVVEWSDGHDLEQKLLSLLVSKLGLQSADDEVGFEESIGGSRWKDFEHAFFRNKYKDNPGAAASSEAWQILSPVRGSDVGVETLNRKIQLRFRRAVRARAMTEKGWTKKVPRPQGPQQLLYGDKVINVVNKSRRRVYPKQEGGSFVANGDIGIVVGQYKGAKSKLKSAKELEVEFATQLGFKFTYYPSEFKGEESSPPLELAYALTVHKTQGSEFGITFVVLPNPCWLLSRELLYTALTRHRDHVVILHQGPIRELRRLSSEGHSDIARRLTNLFSPPSPVEVQVEAKRVFLEQGLIHRSENGQLLRSKSELVIADKLYARGVQYAYEQELKLQDGQVWYPDFTIRDDATGTVFYWEHLGMLHVPQYRRRWERKLASYRANGILPLDEGDGEHGTLVTTRDDSGGGLDAAAIAATIDELFT